MFFLDLFMGKWRKEIQVDKTFKDLFVIAKKLKITLFVLAFGLLRIQMYQFV